MGASGYLKCFNIFLLIIYVITSLILVGYGTFVLVMLLVNGPIDSLEENIALAPLILVLCGAILLITTIFGCYALCTENRCLKVAYSILLTILFLIQIAIGIFALISFQHSEELKKQITLDVSKMFDNYRQEPIDLDVLQTWFECCGVKGAYDFERLPELNHTLPESCCVDYDTTCSLATKNYYHENCADELFRYIVEANIHVGYISVAVAILELLGAILIQVNPHGC